MNAARRALLLGRWRPTGAEESSPLAPRGGAGHRLRLARVGGDARRGRHSQRRGRGDAGRVPDGLPAAAHAVPGHSPAALRPKHDRENSWADVPLRAPAGMSPTAFAVYPDGRVPLCSCCTATRGRAATWSRRRRPRRRRRRPRRRWRCCRAAAQRVRSPSRAARGPSRSVAPTSATRSRRAPTFHLRRKCDRDAAAYEDQWVAAEPGRKRSLLTLRCRGGTLIVHADGTGECFGADDSDCRASTPTTVTSWRATCSRTAAPGAAPMKATPAIGSLAGRPTRGL